MDIPIILDKANPKYKFDKLVSAFYEEAVEFLKNERTDHMFKPFGCDMAYVDADLNYKIMDRLFEVWDELGYNQDIELQWGTPTRYLQKMYRENQKLMQKNDSSSAWPIRRDDTLPVAQNYNQFMNGYYTSRPTLKKNVRDLTRAFHSSLRLTS